MAATKKKKSEESVDLAFMELAPLDEEGDDFEDEEDELVEDEGEDTDLDDEAMMLAETVLGDGDMKTRAQALKDFVKHCMSSGEGY